MTRSFDDGFARECRARFPALARAIAGEPVVFLDGPAGSQVPQSVIEAVGNYLAHTNANHDGVFATSQESDVALGEAHRAVADLLGADDPDCVAFGPNMTTLTFALSRALARTWKTGDEIIVTRTEHDANYTPWVLAAADAGVTVREVGIHVDDATLNLEQLQQTLSDRTRLVAIGAASNATGTINPVTEVCRLARAAGALTFVDAVHWAPHVSMDVDQFGCDFLACSAYKFFGPHVGVMWGRRELLESLSAYKLRPAPDSLPGKWMTGTQNHEGIVGTRAAVDYLAQLGRQLSGETHLSRRAALQHAFTGIRDYEQSLTRRLLDGIEELPQIRVWGIRDTARTNERLPTVSVTHQQLTPIELARQLAERGIFVWHGNYYALPLTSALGVEPEGMVRIGMLHYNTADEVDRLLAALSQC